jgi:hypothetical protein
MRVGEPVSLGDMDTSNPTTSSEIQRRNEISTVSALVNVPIFLSVIALYAFFLSSLYVASISRALRFPIANHLTSIDYVQFIPQTLAIRNGAYGLLLILSMPLLFIILIRFVFQLATAQPTYQATKPWQPRWFGEFLTRVKARFGFSNMTGDAAWALLKISFWSWVVLLLWVFAWDTYWNAGDLVEQVVRPHGRIYKIYVKGNKVPLEAKLFLDSSQYLFAIRDQDDSVIAIPQTEVSLITAPLQSASTDTTPTPINPSPSTPATPSPTSSTPK